MARVKINKKEAAKVFKKIADLLVISGENPFKSRAYQNAARIIEGYDGDLADFSNEALSGKIKGIGKATAEKLDELLSTGKSSYLVKLESALPKGLPDLLRVRGLGPKKIKMLYNDLGIGSLGELEYACEENRLVELSGFGKKSQDNVLTAIKHLKKFAGRFRYSTAWLAANEIHATLEKNTAVKKLKICGSVLRGMETVKDIYLLAVSDNPEGLMTFFTELENVDQITAKGDKKSSVILQNGIAIDLRVVTQKEYPAALNYFTGSAAHNTQLRSRAKSKGYKLNEYGLFSEDEPIFLKNEKDLYQKLGLDWVPPEIREGAGEIEAAENHTLPDLLNEKDIKGILHVHTAFSDGTESVADMANACRGKGYFYLGITDHSKTASYAGGLNEEQIAEQSREIRNWNDKNVDFRIFSGIESDILGDGSLDYDDSVLRQLDFVIASVHSGFSGTKQQMTNRIIRAVENPYTRILGHPTGRLLLGRSGYELDMEKVIDACSVNGVVIELNSNPHRLDIDWRWIRNALNKNVRIAVNPDAHSIKQMDYVSYGVKIAKKGWCEKEDVINTMTALEFQKFLEEK